MKRGKRENGIGEWEKDRGERDDRRGREGREKRGEGNGRVIKGIRERRRGGMGEGRQ